MQSYNGNYFSKKEYFQLVFFLCPFPVENPAFTLHGSLVGCIANLL